MIQISKDLLDKYKIVLKRNNVPEIQQKYYLKWLRYFLDFCQKYNFPQSEQRSLPAFLVKLKDKNQAEHLRKQARHAVFLYQSMNSGKIENTPSYCSKPNHTKTTKPDKFHNRKNNRNQAGYPFLKGPMAGIRQTISSTKNSDICCKQGSFTGTVEEVKGY